MKLHEKPARASASSCANGKPNSHGASDTQNQREGGEDRRLSVIDRRGGLERRHKARRGIRLYGTGAQRRRAAGDDRAGTPTRPRPSAVR